MRVFIYNGGLRLVGKSGVGQAILHQREMLRRARIDTADHWCQRAGAVHINTVLPDSVLAALAGPSISLQGTETRRSSRRNRNFSRGRSPQHAGEREPIQLPRRGECFWDWKWCQIWQWTWWEMPFLTCSPDRLCRAPNGI